MLWKYTAAAQMRGPVTFWRLQLWGKASYFVRGNGVSTPDEVVTPERVKRAKGQGMCRTVLEAFPERKGVKPQILLPGCFCRLTEAKDNLEKFRIQAVTASHPAGAAACRNSQMQGWALQKPSVQ